MERRLRKIITRSLISWLTGDRRRLLRQKRRLLYLLAEDEADELTFRRAGTRWTVPAVNDAVARSLFVDGEYQGREVQRLLDWLSRHGHLGEEKTTIIEAGANLGSSTLPFATATAKRVLAVEPMPENFALLKRNVSMNGLDDRITCVQAAISPSSGQLTMVATPSGGMSEVKAEGTRQGYGERAEGHALVRVPTVSLDELIRLHKVEPDEVAFVWSDTQGYERQVIESGASLWGAGTPLFVELWRDGLRVHGGVSEFVATVARHFTGMIPRRDLLARGAGATTRPVSELTELIESLERRHTDTLLLPRG